MSVTSQLLEFFQIDKQLRGLRSRLEAAERFLSQQSTLLEEMTRKKGVLEAQHKTLKVSVASTDGEAARIEAKIAHLREQMNSAKTAKEYNAFLAELNNFKTQKAQFEERSLENMAKLEEVERQLGVINAQYGERASLVATAKSDRDARELEIKDRVAELQAQRDGAAEALPKRERDQLEALIRTRGDDAMVTVEVIDRRSHEYNCSACMMAITVEVVSAVLSGRLASCPSCKCFLFADADSRGPAEEPKKKPAAPRKTTKKAKAAVPDAATAEADDAPAESAAASA
jgi:uncharacterized protein